MKTRLLIIIGIIITVSFLFTIAYFTNEGLDVDRCTNDTVYRDFTGEIVLRETCIFPFTGKTITDTFLGCDEGFKQINETCIQIKQDNFTGKYFDDNASKCFSDKMDPIYGIIVANQTHQFNNQTCQWDEIVDKENED